MSGGLVLRLKPFEKFIVNGVVMQNGDRRSTLTIRSDGASVLRMRDAIHPDEVDTPVKRLCYITQLIVAGAREPEEAVAELLPGLTEIDRAFGHQPISERIERVRGLIDEKNYYLALRELRNLLPIEAILLDHEPGAFRKTA